MSCPWPSEECDVWDVPFDDLTAVQRNDVRQEYGDMVSEEDLRSFAFSRRRGIRGKPRRDRWYGRRMTTTPVVPYRSINTIIDDYYERLRKT